MWLAGLFPFHSGSGWIMHYKQWACIISITKGVKMLNANITFDLKLRKQRNWNSEHTWSKVTWCVPSGAGQIQVSWLLSPVSSPGARPGKRVVSNQHFLRQEFGFCCCSFLPDFLLCDNMQAMSRKTNTETKSHSLLLIYKYTSFSFHREPFPAAYRNVL